MKIALRSGSSSAESSGPPTDSTSARPAASGRTRIAAWIAKRHTQRDWLKADNYHDLGKLMFAFIMLWAYTNFSQFLIIWSGNLPEEIVYYIERTHGIWGAVIIGIFLLHFAAPFLFLLSRGLKRDPGRLIIVALLVIVMRMVDLIWMLVPALHGPNWVWLDAIALLAFGGLWLGLFTWQLSKRALIPINDPQFESTLEQMHAGGH